MSKPLTLELWIWEIRDERTGRWRKTRYRMTDEDVRQRFGTDACRLEWSLEVRSGDPEANSTSAFQHNVGPPSSEGSAPKV